MSASDNTAPTRREVPAASPTRREVPADPLTRREVPADPLTRPAVTAFEVDVDDLREVVGAMGACQRRLLDLAADVEALHAALEPDWSGLAADAHSASYRRWRDDCAEMITALAGLRALVTGADGHYRASVTANLALWEQVR